MSEILTLAEKFKQKQNEQAQTIEQQLDSVMTKLNTSITKSLRESENIIKTGTADLNEQNEQLQLMLEQHRDNIHTALSSYTSAVQALIGKGLSGHTDAVQTMIESHTDDIQSLIENKQDEITQVIKSDLTKWTIVAVITLFGVLMLGFFMGIGIAKKVIDPKVIYYEQPAKTQQYTPYNP